ncbi:conserved hypothetical protein [Talaromyces stipitatus ATCC 10500]|uniref:Zn(2)-C6 fungal-type domain-containing protein n=1 Tax=Talaromyces stipitatus (strain ATCC 10500 / CBS 375.48 / QM 6759 / NRRL 1006) TaxID=441959 RepID=B8LV66_TALSN|nr:uncharacterized protein TSTA_065700 [Talaromyces stipitatus ATCC 10500]EED23116.1 conserved hypothetical protein [Talaromyces stipitatus ATCC 10500]
MERAQFVCTTCSARKKGCDKALPACGFCAKRGLSCKYDGPARKERSFRPYNPGKYFVASGTLNAPISPISIVNSASSPDTPSVTASISQSIHESLYQQVRDVLNLANLTAEDISKRYFDSFHRLYPIISPELFYQAQSKYAHGGSISPSTDYSILVLAMFLAITLPGHHRPTNLSLSDQEQLYVKVKSLIAQIQTAISPSFALVQVMFIVTIWEYTRARPEAAYSSINACSSLARILGVGDELLEKSAPYQSNIITNLVEIVKRNVAWAVIMLERIILVELNPKAIRPLTGYPNIDCQLPLDLLPSDSSLSQSIDYQSSISATLSCLETGNVSWFGRQAQAIFLLDNVLEVVRTASKTGITQGILQGAVELDGMIRNFLAMLLEESRQKKTSLCSSVAFSIRALFLLHWSIFDALPTSGNESNYQARNLSWTAINSACNMTIDAITHAQQEPDSPVPICSFYILQEAIRYLSEHQKVAGDEATVSDKDMLIHADKEYRSTYIF